MQEKIIIPDFPVIVAVSGGVDSMVLLNICLQKISKNHIFVAHFNHGLRGAESDGDEIFVKNFCEKNGIAFFSEKQNIWELAKKEKASIEATARKYRYEFFAKIAQKMRVFWVLTAHHLDDRIETMLFNLIRGTKFSGICALKYEQILKIQWKNIAFMRPLLGVTKSEILAFAKGKNILFRQDITNFDTTIQRNFLRHEILPKFANINPNYQKSLQNFIEYTEAFQMAQNLRASDFLLLQSEKYEKIEQKFQKKFSKNIIFTFSLLDFWEKDFLEQTAILERLYKQQNDGNFGLSEGNLDELLRFILEGKNSFGVKKIKNLHLERRGEWIFCLESWENN